jgi:hypothetical protein
MKLPARYMSFSALVLAFAAGTAPAQTAFTYQGELKQSGQNANGPYDMQFRLYDLPNGGVQVGSTLCVDNVAVADGRFSTNIDFGQQFASTAPRYLEVAIRQDTGQICAVSAGFTLLSRQLLAATPRAAAANVANALAAPDGSPNPAVSVDNAGQVGIGTSSPLAVLDVRGPNASYVRVDNINGDLRANGGADSFFGIVNEGNISTGRTEFLNSLGTRLVSMENSGRIGIGALPNGIDRLFVNGTIATTPITRYKTIHGSAFIPDTVSRESGGFLLADEAGATGYGFGNPFFAPVELPHGAVVTQLRVYAIDERPTDISVTLGRTELANGGTAAMATVGTSGSSSSVQSPFWSNIVWSTILNDTHVYWLKANLDSFGNARHKIIGVRITYTVTAPVP